MSRKDEIIERLKENGCRITKQRKILIDIILENDCASCKEIFYKASQEDDRIGVATVYRMINALEKAAQADVISSWRMIPFLAFQRKNWIRSSGMASDGAVT